MSKIDPNLGRSNFFPGKNKENRIQPGGMNIINRNSPERVKELSSLTSQDAKVDIPESVKDFSRIKKAAISAPELDNQQRISELKDKISKGTYEIDYDALADKMLTQDF